MLPCEHAYVTPHGVCNGKPTWKLLNSILLSQELREAGLGVCAEGVPLNPPRADQMFPCSHPWTPPDECPCCRDGMITNQTRFPRSTSVATSMSVHCLYAACREKDHAVKFQLEWKALCLSATTSPLHVRNGSALLALRM